MRARMIVLALLISSGVAPSAKPKGDAARELVGAWAAAVNSGKGLEAMDRLFAAEYVLHTPGADIRGREAVKAWLGGVLQRCPALRMVPVATVVEGAMVSSRWVVQCTSDVGSAGSSLAIDRIANGQFAEGWEVVSSKGWLDGEANRRE